MYEILEIEINSWNFLELKKGSVLKLDGKLIKTQGKKTIEIVDFISIVFGVDGSTVTALVKSD